MIPKIEVEKLKNIFSGNRIALLCAHIEWYQPYLSLA